MATKKTRKPASRKTPKPAVIKTPKPHVILDMKGAVCPGPLLSARRMLDELLPGEVLLLISDCPGTKDDIASWSRYSDAKLLKTEKVSQGGTGYHIRKGKAKRVAPNAVLDMRGTTCPGPIVQAKKLLDGMRKGEVLELLSDCPGIRADVRSWAKATGAELTDAREAGPGEYEFHIRKR
jgi:TusA-related sulfurtransferase